KNHAMDRLRREARRSGKEQASMLMLGQRAPAPPPGLIADDQLRLIFACCHPAMDPGTRVALTLRTLCGLGTAEIARSFLVSEATLAQRLVRLGEPGRSSWDHAKIDEGTRVLDRAARLRRPGPYQLQAAIAACHAAAGEASATDWAEIAALYAALARHEPSPVVHANRAV